MMKKITAAILAFAFAACGPVAVSVGDDFDRSYDLYDLQSTWAPENWVASNGLTELWIRADGPIAGVFTYQDYTGDYTGTVQLIGDELIFYINGLPTNVMDVRWRFDPAVGDDVLVIIDQSNGTFFQRGLIR